MAEEGGDRDRAGWDGIPNAHGARSGMCFVAATRGSTYTMGYVRDVGGSWSLCGLKSC